jgi:hypothetical protein
MTIEIAAFLGMGLIVLWGVIALLIALKTSKADQPVNTDIAHSH